MKKLFNKKTDVVAENTANQEQLTDYNVYVMNKKEKFLSVIGGFLIGFVACYLYFNSMIVGTIIGLFCGYKAIGIYRNMKKNKRLKELRIQFRDMLESLSNSYTVGMTASRAFSSAYEDMKLEHGEKAYITKELNWMCIMHNNGEEIKDLLLNFADRSGIDDVRSFANVFSVAENLAGDRPRIIRETRDMISERIAVELEIQTMITGQKNQLNILAIMPVVMALLTRSFETDSGNITVIIIKIVALGIFIFAYWLGTKIVDIKV